MKEPVLTLVSPPASRALDHSLVDSLCRQLGALHVDWLAPSVAADLFLPSGAHKSHLAATVQAMIEGLPVDAALQEASIRRKKALIADMDSTMIDQECIDELAEEVGVREHVAAITARAMNGEIEFEPALRERVALLKNLPLSVADRVMERRITFASGGRQLLATMKANGAWCALVSGGFTLFTQKVADELGFDEHRANRLESMEGLLTGTVAEPILGSSAKVEALRTIAAARGLSADDFIAVGDGANDLPMLLEAGSGVALHAKPSVAARAPMRIDHGDLTALLYLQGYRQQDIVEP